MGGGLRWGAAAAAAAAAAAGDPEAPALPAKKQAPSPSTTAAAPGGGASDLPPPAEPAPPPPDTRVLSPLAARLETLNLSFYDAHRARASGLAWAWCAVCWLTTTVGVSLGAARGGWWPTHVPLGFLASGVQAFALVVALLNSSAGPDWARGRAGLATLTAVQAATVVSTARINRSWASTATLFGFRVVGSETIPPGYVAFNAGAWLYLGGSVTLVTFLGTRPPRRGEPATAPAATVQRFSILAGVVVASIGFWVCVGTTAATAVSSSTRRAGAGKTFYALDADALWLLYLAPIPPSILLTPGNQATGLAHACTRPLAGIGSIAIVVVYAYLWSPAMRFGNRVGLGLIIAGFLAVITVGMVEPGGPCARAARAVVAWARGRVAAARRRRGPQAPLFRADAPGGGDGSGGAVTLLLAPAGGDE